MLDLIIYIYVFISAHKFLRDFYEMPFYFYKRAFIFGIKARYKRYLFLQGLVIIRVNHHYHYHYCRTVIARKARAKSTCTEFAMRERRTSLWRSLTLHVIRKIAFIEKPRWLRLLQSVPLDELFRSIRKSIERERTKNETAIFRQIITRRKNSQLSQY